MARAATTKQYNSFINGLITDANEFSAPDNAVQDMENVDVNSKGEGNRRLGLEAVDATSSGYDTFNPLLDSDETVMQCVEWPHAGVIDDTSVVACQVAGKLYIYDVDHVNYPKAAGIKDVDGMLSIFGVTVEDKVWDMVVGDDHALYITTGVSKPIRFQWDDQFSVILGSEYELYVRDTKSLPDGNTVEVRDVNAVPAKNVLYNLQNNGWTVAQLNAYYAANAAWPSKGEQPFRAKTALGVADYAYLFNLNPSTGPAPSGHYIWPLWLTTRASILHASGTVDEDSIPDGTGPSTCAFYANRIWYGGFNTTTASPDGIGSTLYYSQIIGGLENPNGHESYAACYSENDVTDEFFSDILATDGGSIFLPDVGLVRKVRPIGNVLVIFATNGIWVLDGGNGEVFKADSFGVNLSTIDPPVSFRSITSVSTSLVYFGDSDIISLSPSTDFKGSVQLTSLTADKYKEGYLEVLALQDVENIQGYHDRVGKYVQWGYGGSAHNATQKLLRFNTKTGAFTRYNMTGMSGSIAGMASFSSETEVSYFLRSGISSVMLTRMHKFTGTNFGDGVGANENVPYIVLWPEHVGAPHLNKSALYLHTFLRRTETEWISSGTFDLPSGLQAEVYWDFMDVNTTGPKKSGPHDVYRLIRLEEPAGGYPKSIDNYKTIVKNRTKIKGKGIALQTKFIGQAGKDFNLMGWTIPVTVEIV